MELTVFYDGDCGICQASARLIARLDRRHRLNLVPLQTAPATDEMPSPDELLDSLHALDADGRWWVGADALIEIAQRIAILRPLTLATRIPFAVRAIEIVYAFVARNRHRLSRALRLAACRLPHVRRPVGKGGSSE